MAGVKNEPVTLTTESRPLRNIANGQVIQRQGMDECPLIYKVEDSPSDKSSQNLG